MSGPLFKVHGGPRHASCPDTYSDFWEDESFDGRFSLNDYDDSQDDLVELMMGPRPSSFDDECDVEFEWLECEALRLGFQEMYKTPFVKEWQDFFLLQAEMYVLLELYPEAAYSVLFAEWLMYGCRFNKDPQLEHSLPNHREKRAAAIKFIASYHLGDKLTCQRMEGIVRNSSSGLSKPLEATYNKTLQVFHVMHWFAPVFGGDEHLEEPMMPQSKPKSSRKTSRKRNIRLLRSHDI